MSTAYERLITSQTNLLFYKNKLVKDSAELIRISQKNYKEGKSDLTSVIMMQQSFREILTGYNSALTDYYTDWIDFLREVNQEDFNLFDRKSLILNNIFARKLQKASHKVFVPDFYILRNLEHCRGKIPYVFYV